MCQTDKCVVAQGFKVVLIINLIIIDHSRMIQGFRFIEISKYDDDGQLMSGQVKIELGAAPQTDGRSPPLDPCFSSVLTECASLFT